MHFIWRKGGVSIDKKVCSICEKEKELSEYYLQQKVRKDGSKYNYCPPYCKECTKKKTIQWEIDNPEKLKVNRKRTNDNRKDKIYQYGLISQKRGSRREWQRRNMSKLVKNHQERMENKLHQITETEWLLCKEYFDNRCAYCGLTHENHKKIYKQDLHREHVNHNGSNKLDNCVPSCKICNSSKKDSEFLNWYNRDNFVFSEERFNRILDWLEEDYKYIMIGETNEQ